jgi:preprotein translocase subunit SecE
MFQQLRIFLNEAKSEFKKISWPSPEEIKGSTTVVFVTIGFLMLLLWIYDLVVNRLLMLLIK